MAFDKSKYMRRYWQERPGQKAEYNRRWRSKNRFRDQENKYGMRQGEFAERLLAQGSDCAICEEPFTNTPHVDHNHETGVVRDLLCSRCNVGVGHVELYGERLLAYLRKHNG